MSSPDPAAAVRHGRRLAWGLVPVAALAFLLASRFPKEPPPPAPPSAPPAQDVTPAARSDRPALRRSAGARQVLHRSTPARPTSPPPEPAEAAEEGEAAEDSGVLPEGGRLAPASVPFTPEAIQAAMQESLPGIEACVDAWILAAPPEKALEGRLTLEVILSTEGVQEAALLDVDGVPEPMLGCIGGAVYEIAWPRPEEETTIRYPFRLIAE